MPGGAACRGAVLPAVRAARRGRSQPDAGGRDTSTARGHPWHLADKIRQSKSALEGERKQVTVLFADVKGPMELAEQMDPEAWTAIMQRFFNILAESVERFEGFVSMSSSGVQMMGVRMSRPSLIEPMILRTFALAI